MKLTNKEAIANLNHIYGIVSPDIQRSLDLAIKALEEKPQGEWRYTTHHARRYRMCPFCKCEKEDDRSAGWFYCCHCGARMKGSTE